MSLTDAKIRAAKAKSKAYSLTDEGGLSLEIPPSGKKRWRFRYQFQKKRNRLSLGVYPDVSLKDARKKRDEMRVLLGRGIDPGVRRAEVRREESGQENFEAVAREWFEKHVESWSVRHAETVIERLEKNVFPYIGGHPIKTLGTAEMLDVLRRIERRGAVEVARRVRQIMSQVFRYAIPTGRAERDPAADVKGALPPATRIKHHASITDPRGVGALMRAIDGFDGTLVVHCALRLAPLVFVRPGELRHGEWMEINFEAREWRIAAEKMKARRQHIVPLSRQALEVLREVHAVTGDGRYIFPSVRTQARPMSENTVNVALRRLGYGKDEMTGHGFRSMASTLLNEQGWNPDAIERQLAHVEGNSVRAAYNYAEHLEERRRMMQAWADYLDSLKEGCGGER